MNDETLWWILQISLPERYQQNIFSKLIPREELLCLSFDLIPKQIRTERGRNLWGLADLRNINDEIIVCKLTIRPPQARVAEEPELGTLEETVEPRFYTTAVVHIPLQIITVQKSADMARYAKSANTYSEIFEDLLAQAINNLNQQEYYQVEVQPIAKVGSFIEWVHTLDKLNKIIIHYSGPNLPAGSSGLIEDIKNTARTFKDKLRSRKVDLVANEPKLADEEIKELDEATADRRLNMRATGTRSGIGTSWNSSDKPIPESARISLSEDQLVDSDKIAAVINSYLGAYFEKYKKS